MFNWLFRLLGSMLSFFSSITGTYILALLLYALIFKILFIPLTIKQQKNQIKMAKLAPKIQLIKAKYKGRVDQKSMQAQQQEIMEMQQKEGYNGCSGCMPLLIQLPIIMLLYAVIQSPITYMTDTTDVVTEYNKNYEDSSYDTPQEIIDAWGDDIYKKDENGGIYEVNDQPVRVEITYEMIVAKLNARYLTDEQAGNKKTNEITLIGEIYRHCYDLGGGEDDKAFIESAGIKFDSIPNFRVFGKNLAATPSLQDPSIIIIIPFLAAIFSWLTMFVSRKLNGNTNPAAQGANEQAMKSMMIMDLVMPLMTLFIAFRFSGMLGLYWIIQSVLGLTQTFIVSRAMPIPHFTEEEMKEIRRKEKEIEKAARAAAKETRHRSLHYIDEDDYEELPDAPVNESTKKSTNLGDAPEIKD